MLLVKLISKKKSLYIDGLDKKDLALNKRDLASINKTPEMLDRNKDIKMPDVRHIYSENKQIIFNQSRSKIEFI